MQRTMRYSRLLIPTIKEVPADAVVVSHQLMMRAGMIRKVAAGVYTYLPLGWRVFQKVANIVREEMNRADAQEILMPAVQPAELWQESGRWGQYGPELLRFKDRKAAEFCIGPTHEEVVTSLVRDEVHSYRQLPVNLYQIQTKFRDEMRPRFGLMRGREFLMKDAYSFDIDEDGANKSYDSMFHGYQRIFARCGLEFRPVEADTGSIGGARSHEFQVLADTGEDAIVHCTSCGYAANVELAAIGHVRPASSNATPGGVEKVSTPGQKTIDDVASFLGVPKSQVMKAVLLIVDEGLPSARPVMALCRGDNEVNEVKLRRAIGAKTARMMTDEEVVVSTGSVAGYVGPVGLKKPLEIVADRGLEAQAGMITGANEADTHLTQVMWGRDVEVPLHDLRTAEKGDPCGRCSHPFEAARGIEVGHVFFLGTKYSEAMKCTVLDDEGKERIVVMGCYGIGVTRTAAAAIEQNHDADGIVWPAPIAPFTVALVALGAEKETVETAERLYRELERAGVDVLFDDRDERPGVKFKDHDLIGCPVRLAVGARGLKEGIVELKKRSEGRDGTRKVPVDDAVAETVALVNALLDAARAKAENVARA
jgi:prolyl-tRNA synthetase